MTEFVDAKDHATGALIASLPAEALPPINDPQPAGLARRLRVAFVASGRLTVGQAATADFEVRDGTDPRH